MLFHSNPQAANGSWAENSLLCVDQGLECSWSIIRIILSTRFATTGTEKIRKETTKPVAFTPFEGVDNKDIFASVWRGTPDPHVTNWQFWRSASSNSSATDHHGWEAYRKRPSSKTLRSSASSFVMRYTVAKSFLQGGPFKKWNKILLKNSLQTLAGSAGQLALACAQLNIIWLRSKIQKFALK